MSEDLISRLAAIDAVEESRRLNNHKNAKEACYHEYEHIHFLKILRDLPPAQPEQKTGKWVNDGKGLYKCTACGELWLHWWATVMPIERMYKEMRFCPHCGAKMERSEDADN